ncbi:hypothetical protein [Streptomyces soliscabiei]|uniref:hypothetical protein n=1 Tax=Streptomyces soliscabiei TaxID=588897 RepID=UPI0029BEDAC1|nr:hypothetical protein [Streptomyces sp. NY05-11A]MDX2682212.1 hypothetical protein [Streptomyces sp. NY05-11A]
MTIPTTAPTTAGAERRLEGGWFQRLAWTALVWGSLGFLAWVPFLYVAVRRGLASDWTAFGSFSLYECVIVTWAVVSDTDDGDALLGVAIMVALVTASVLLLFAVFDQKTQAAGSRSTSHSPSASAPASAPASAYGAGQPYSAGQPNPYQQGYRS